MRVRVTPKSSSDAIDGVREAAEGPAFTARVRAVPADGKANGAVEQLLAERLGIAPGAVRLIAGAKSRVKSFAIAGDSATIERRLDETLTGLGHPRNGTEGTDPCPKPKSSTAKPSRRRFAPRSRGTSSG